MEVSSCYSRRRYSFFPAYLQYFIYQVLEDPFDFMFRAALKCNTFSPLDPPTQEAVILNLPLKNRSDFLHQSMACRRVYLDFIFSPHSPFPLPRGHVFPPPVGPQCPTAPLPSSPLVHVCDFPKYTSCGSLFPPFPSYGFEPCRNPFLFSGLCLSGTRSPGFRVRSDPRAKRSVLQSPSLFDRMHFALLVKWPRCNPQVLLLFRLSHATARTALPPSL